MGQQPRSMNIGGHVRQDELNGLQVSNGLAKRISRLRILDTVFHGRTRDADRKHRSQGPAVVQRFHGDAKAVPLAANAVLHRNAHVLKSQGDGVGRPLPHLVFVLSNAQPFGRPSTTRAMMPLCRAFLSTVQNSVYWSAYSPLVIQHFCPLMT